MKAFFITAGLVAVGAAGVQSAFADDVTPASPRIWSVAATLRGFYDNNYNIGNNNKDSFGIELSPSVNVNASMQQTEVGFKYTYGLYWYQNRQQIGDNPFDQSHQLDFWLDHSFDERWKTTISDSLGLGQEPELIGAGTGSANSGVPFRVNGDNLGNHLNIALDTQWTRQFSTELSYGNNYYNYENSGATVTNNTVSPSLAGELNRVDQNIGLDLQWHLQPETMAFVGYSFDWLDYIANEPIQYYAPKNVTYKSDSRNAYTHQFYVGLQHQFTANLGGTVKVGANYVDNYNDPLEDTTSWSPYANLSLTYTYLPGSYAELGFTHDINSTYITGVSTSNGSLTQYQETSTLYATVNHRITEKLLGSVIGQVAFSDYQGGAYTSDTDTDFSLGLNLSYQFNRYFSADAGYNYDNLQSEVPGTAYQRNRVYVGVTATY